VGFGVTIPFDGIPLSEHGEWLRRLEDLGYSDLWSSEADGTDAFTPLALASAHTSRMRLGTAIVPVFTRGPALLAQSAAAMAEAAPGRFALGVGTSSEVIVSRWNGLAFDKPYQRTRDLVRFLKLSLAGEKVDQVYETFSVRGFRLGRPPAVPPSILVAALRPQMLRLAGREADGAIINWLAATDVPKVVAELHAGTQGDLGSKQASKEVVARVFVCPTEDESAARQLGRRLIAAYLNVPVYAKFHQWLGRAELLEPMWSAWSDGDRKRALQAIPDQVVDELILHGSFEELRSKVDAYLEAGVTTVTLALLPTDSDLEQVLASLAPSQAVSRG